MPVEMQPFESALFATSKKAQILYSRSFSIRVVEAGVKYNPRFKPLEANCFPSVCILQLL